MHASLHRSFISLYARSVQLLAVCWKYDINMVVILL